MQASGAAKSFVDAQSRPDYGLQSVQSAPIDDHIIEMAAEALFEFVFSGCNRLDGKRRWADCDEETKNGFRGEAAAALEAVWPMLSRKIGPRALLKSELVGQRG